MPAPPSDQPRIAVLGSVNMDIAVRTESLPSPGDTVMGTSLTTEPGGKGANQAIAAARGGADVTFLGAVGSDAFAQELRESLAYAGVDVGLLREVDGPSGVAVVTVDSSAENTIVVVGGANAAMTELTDSERDVIADASILVCQLELPVETIAAGAAHAHAHGTAVLLNLSPVRTLNGNVTDHVDILVLNRSEEAAIDPEVLASCPHVVVTLGSGGARYRPRGGTWTGEWIQVPSYAVDAVDTTGAGDVFAGVLAATWHRGPDVALRYACAAGALATTVPGAGGAAPTVDRIEELL